MFNKGAPATYHPSPRKSYTKIPNEYRPYVYCGLDKAIDARVHKEKISL